MKSNSIYQRYGVRHKDSYKSTKVELIYAATVYVAKASVKTTLILSRPLKLLQV